MSDDHVRAREPDVPVDDGRSEADSVQVRAREGESTTNKDLRQESDEILHEWPSLTGRQRAFLRAYSAHGTIRKACEQAGVHRQTHYDWLSTADYAAAFTQVEEDFADRIEEEAYDQAMQGVAKMVLYKGEPVRDPRYPDADPPVYLFEYQHPSAVLIKLLQGAKPEKYRENVRVENAGEGSVHVIYDDDFYGNDAHARQAAADSTAAEAPASDPA